jgi:hypothetical protein
MESVILLAGDWVLLVYYRWQDLPIIGTDVSYAEPR